MKSYARLQGEKDKAYEAFMTWLRLGSSRTYSGTAKTAKVSLATIKRYASLYTWKDRLQEWEFDQDAKRLRSLERHQQSVAELETQILNDTVLIASHAVHALLESIEGGTTVLSQAPTKEWVDMAIRLSRQPGHSPQLSPEQRRAEETALMQEMLDRLQRHAKAEADKKALAALEPKPPTQH